MELASLIWGLKNFGKITDRFSMKTLNLILFSLLISTIWSCSTSKKRGPSSEKPMTEREYRRYEMVPRADFTR